MTPTDLQALREQLMRHEGLKLQAYQDSLGYWTIGVGRLIDARMGGGITAKEALYLLDNDIERCLVDLRTRFPWFETLDVIRQRALLDLRFNLGPAKLLGFGKFIAALGRGDYVTAGRELVDSKWYRQVGTRGPRIVQMVRTGQDPDNGPVS
jgi:lysozyme